MTQLWVWMWLPVRFYKRQEPSSIVLFDNWSFHSSGLKNWLFKLGGGGAHPLSKTRLVTDYPSMGFRFLSYVQCLCRSHLSAAANKGCSLERLSHAVTIASLCNYRHAIDRAPIPCSKTNCISPGVSPIHYFVKGRVERQYGCRDVAVLKQGHSDLSAA